MLCLGVEIELEVAHGVATVREKGDLLVELMALRLEHLTEPAFRFLVIVRLGGLLPHKAG